MIIKKRRVQAGAVLVLFCFSAAACAAEPDADAAARAQPPMLRLSDMLAAPRPPEAARAGAGSNAGPGVGLGTAWPALSLRMSDGLMRSTLQQASSELQRIRNRASDLAAAALNMLGTEYRRGGSTPEHGLDCSGLVGYVFMQSWGAVLPRTAAQISRIGHKVSAQDLQPGDLVFYNTVKRGISHVGIYLGDNKFIHSPSPGGRVRIDSMNVAYWKRHFNGARRIDTPQQKNALAVRDGQ